MTVLLCGALTYDTVMVLDNKFKRLTPLADAGQPIVAHFTIPDLRRQFGGSAGNIAYNLNMLGIKPLIMTTVGMDDFKPYADWLETNRISQAYIRAVEHSYTSQLFITSDMDDNQMLAFHPGALLFSHLYNRVSREIPVALGVLSGHGSENMVLHAQQFVEAEIPFLFDPGRDVGLFSGDELLNFVEQAEWILLNEQEWAVMYERTKLMPQQVAQRVDALIITRGSAGAVIYKDEAAYDIPPAHPLCVSDSAGCGDAFCAGIVYGLLGDVDWETTGRIASLLGAIELEHHGTQNHSFTLDAFKARFQDNFGYALLTPPPRSVVI